MRDAATLRLNDERYVLRLTWAALVELRREWGADDEQFYLTVDAALKLRDPEALALLVETMGGPAAERLMEESPALNPVAEAVRFAWIRAYDGEEAAKEDAGDREAANPPKSPLIRLWRRMRRRWKRG